MSTQVTSCLVVVAAEGVAGSEGGSSDVLHVPALQPQTGAASGDDGATDPRSEYRSPSECLSLKTMTSVIMAEPFPGCRTKHWRFISLCF